MQGRCAKLEVTAVIVTVNNEIFEGSNWCLNPQDICPRLGMKTGEGYELCKNVCNQRNHAEIDACIKAGGKAKDSTMYLLGHTYCCDNCKKVMKEYGIKEVYYTSVEFHDKEIIS